MRFFPKQLLNKYIFLTFTAWAVVLLGSTINLLNQPFPGFTVKNVENTVVIDEIFNTSLALQTETPLLAISSPHDSNKVAITVSNHPLDPNVFKTFTEFNQFLQYNRQLAQVFSGEALIITTPNGDGLINLEARPISSLPFSYWMTAISVLLSSLLAVSVFSLKVQNLAAKMLVASALSLMFLSLFTSAYLYRVLVLDPTIFEPLLRLQHLFGNWFVYALMTLMCVYPKQLVSKTHIIFLLYIAPLFFWLNGEFQWFELPFSSIFFSSFLAFILFLIAGITQIYHAQKDPLSIAQLKWFMISLVPLPVLDILLYLLPITLGKLPVIPQWFVQISLSFIFLGIALGITRYRLFDVERWWFKTWVWLLAGVLVILVDIALVTFVHLNTTGALTLSLIFVAWIYFPARQWLWKKLAKVPDVRLEDYLPMLVESVFNPSLITQPINNWKHCLQEIFQPISIETSAEAVQQTQIITNGLSLQVPNIQNENESIILSGRNKGTRLFSKEDKHLAEAINEMLRTILDVKIASEEGARIERNRIMRDLHDDVGANILSMIYRAKDEDQALYARETLDLSSHTKLT